MNRGAYNLTETAGVLGVSPATVKKLAAAGELRGAKRLGTAPRSPWIIPARSVDDFLRSEDGVTPLSCSTSSPRSGTMLAQTGICDHTTRTNDEGACGVPHASLRAPSAPPVLGSPAMEPEGAYKHADGRWIAYWTTEHGERRTKSFRGRQAEMLAKAHAYKQRELVRLIRDRQLTRDQITEAQAASIELRTVIAEYCEDLKARGCTDTHVAEVKRLCEKFADWCPTKHIGAVQTRHINEYLKALPKMIKADTLSARNRNVHLGAVKALLNFAYRRQRYIPNNPAEFIERFPEGIGGEGINVQRPFTPAEYQTLVDSEHVKGCWRGLYYRVRFQTLIRGTELAKLCRRDLKQDGNIVYLDVHAKAAKTGQPRLVPLPNGLAAELLKRAMTLRPTDRLFPSTPTRKTFENDQKRAGVEFETTEGKLYLKAIRLSGTLWLRELGVGLHDEMLLSGGSGRGAERTRVWAYHNMKAELPRLHGHVCRLSDHLATKDEDARKEKTA